MADLGESRADYRAKTVATLCSKGGVGKSTLAAQIISDASRLGLKVLGIDLDPNGTLSRLTGTVSPVGELSIGDVLVGAARPQQVARVPVDWQPDIAFDRPWIQGGPLLPGGAVHILPAPDRGLEVTTSRSGTDAEQALLEALAVSEIGEHYDLIVVDPPASTSSTLYLALYASEHLVFPLQTESAALSGLTLTVESAIKFSSLSRRRVNGIGVVATMLDRTTEHTLTLAAAQEWMDERFKGQIGVLNPQIPRRTIVSEAGSSMVPVSRLVTGKLKNADIASRYAAVALAVVAAVTPERLEAIFDAIEKEDLPEEIADIIYAALESRAETVNTGQEN
ncbi:ParA family protein [Rhodococcus sp. D-46]|uniref:AAA family ATPase n=1 Tax=Rhodococcus sp. D-46 TaxID=2716265 RepID=UPI0013F6782D|nr:ParA family protein [Rhodococcus sp. D-46]